MAYNFPTATQDFGYGIGETEEERRRREEQERLQREQEAAMAAQQQAEAEAQRQREQQEAQRAAQEQPGQAVAQVPAGMAAPNPYGSAIAQGQTTEGPPPTQGGPVAPDQANIEEQRRLQQAQQEQAVQAAQAQQPVAPVAPEQAQQPQAAPAAPGAPAPMSMEERIAAAAQRAQERAAASGGQQPQPQVEAQPAAPAMPQMPQPGPGVQVASVEPGAGVAEAAKAQQAAQLPPSSVGSLQQVAQQQQTLAEQRDHLDDVANIYNDPGKLMEYSRNESNPREGRLMAAKLLKKQATQLEDAQKAEEIIGSGDVTAMERAIRSKKEEGSILKAMLYARLGLTKLAEDEQAKLGAGSKFEAVVGPNNERALVQYDANMMPIGGYDTAGRELSPKQLAMFGANAMPTKAHLMPSVHGTPVVKEINGKQIGGVRMYDPRSQTSYVLVGNQRVADENWVTTGQAPTAVYNAAGARAQGTAAGEGYTPTPLPSMPGSTAGTPEELQKQLQRAQGDVAGSDRQIADLNRLPASDPTKQTRIATIQAEKAKAQQQVQQLSGAIQGLTPGGGTVGTTVGGTVAEQKKNLAIAEARAREELQVAGKRSEGFNKHIDETITPDAMNGDKIASTRKEQFGLFDRPGVDAGKIFGIANGAGAAPGDQRWTMFRDVLLGKVSESEDQIRQRAAALGLNPQEQSAVAEYAIKNAEINALTLKATAGPGSVSEAEQRLNQERNVDPTKVPMLGGYNAMAQSQFNGDLARYKGDWSTTSKATNTAQLEKEWRKEKADITKLYTDMARQRIDYISSMGNTAAAIKEGYRRFPVPQYDPATETWIKKKPLGSYER